MSAPLPSYWQRAVHLTALWAYGVCQPVLSLLEGNPEFLVVRGATRAEVIVFVVVLILGPPLASVAYVRFAAFLSDWVADVLYRIVFAAFLVPVALQIAALLDPSRTLALALVVLLCVGGVFCYSRFRVAQLFLGFSIVLPILGVASFFHGLPLATTDARAAPSKDVAEPVPVVVLVFDEFPASSLMNRNGEVDAIRYPNFGKLARNATWYPKATTVGEFTPLAVPAILSGRVPESSALPRIADYPANLFTLLARDYSMNVREQVTHLCPESECEAQRDPFLARVESLTRDLTAPYLADTLPQSLSGHLRGRTGLDRFFRRAIGRRTADFDAFLGDFSPREQRATLHFLHTLFPHEPWAYSESGRSYRERRVDALFNSSALPRDAWLVQQRVQGHLVQVKYTDALVGRLLERLQQAGIYDRALVVFVADHGVSIGAGVDRRLVATENVADIARVPLLIKYPGQTRGVVDMRAARTVDILPTIADVLGIRQLARVDGRSLLGPAPHRSSVIVVRKKGSVLRVPLAQVEQQMRATIQRNVSLFGDGDDSLYRIGTNRAVLGLVIEKNWPRSRTTRVRVDGEEELSDVDLESPLAPTRISGVVETGTVASGVELAIAVNGRVWALTRCVNDLGLQRFRALVPESSLVQGFNQVDVFAVTADGSGPGLEWLGGNRDPAG